MNYKKTLITLLILGCGSMTNAQTISVVQDVVKPLVGLKSIQVYTGIAWDKYQNMNMEMIADRTQNMPNYTDATKDMKQNITYSSLGLGTGVNLSYYLPSLTNSTVSAEYRVGASVNLLKESLVDFTSTENDTRETLMYCFVENDVRINSDLLFTLGDHKKFSIYSGVGINASNSFDNELLIFENYDVETGAMNEFIPTTFNSKMQTLEGKSVVYARAYIPMGVKMKVFRHLESSFEVKIGKGFEQVIGGNATSFKTREVSFGLKYNFARNKALSIFDLL